MQQSFILYLYSVKLCYNPFYFKLIKKSCFVMLCNHRAIYVLHVLIQIHLIWSNIYSLVCFQMVKVRTRFSLTSLNLMNPSKEDFLVSTLYIYMVLLTHHTRLWIVSFYTRNQRFWGISSLQAKCFGSTLLPIMGME